MLDPFARGLEAHVTKTLRLRTKKQQQTGLYQSYDVSNVEREF